MPKAPIGPQVGRRQAGPPANAQAPTQAARGPRALHGALVLPLDQLVPDPDQPRRTFDAAALAELAASLKEYGVLQPLVVREDGYLDDERACYMIIAGGRRYAAARLAGLAHLPGVVRDTEGAAQRTTQLVENLQRQDLAPLEEARAFQELMEADGISAEELGKRLHISGQYVRTRLQLLSDQVIADAVEREQLPPTVAREIIRLPDTQQKTEIRAQVQAGQRVSHSDLQRIKDYHSAVGVANPRSKGGGRSAHKAESPLRGSERHVESSESNVRDQPMVDISPTVDVATVPQDATPDELQGALGALDAVALEAVLGYGISRAWSCQELARKIGEWRVGTEKVTRVSN